MEERREFAKTEKFASGAGLPTVVSVLTARGTQTRDGHGSGHACALMGHARQHLGGAALQRVFSAQQGRFPLVIAQDWRSPRQQARHQGARLPLRCKLGGRWFQGGRTAPRKQQAQCPADTQQRLCHSL